MVLLECIIRIDASLFEELPCFKYDVINSINDLNSLSNTTEALVFGNYCLRNLKEIEFSRFVNVTLIDIGKHSLVNIETAIIQSIMIKC